MQTETRWGNLQRRSLFCFVDEVDVTVYQQGNDTELFVICGEADPHYGNDDCLNVALGEAVRIAREGTADFPAVSDYGAASSTRHDMRGVGR